MVETVSNVGEFGLIRRLHVLLEKEGAGATDVIIGMGDDTASFHPSPGHHTLVTCDSMVAGRHYLPEHISAFDLGRRAMVSNISDIGAMGGLPRYAVVSLGLMPDTPVTDIEAMYRGFLAELNPLGAVIVGGNLTKTECAFIDITLMGEVVAGKEVRRFTAQPGDVILVTGYPGEAAAGLQLLLQDAARAHRRHLPLVTAYHTPSHRAREGKAIADAGLATAMIDVSDGLVGDLGHICEESGLGASVIQEHLPVSANLREAALVLKKIPYDLVLQDSDDYELIVTCSPQHMEQVHSIVAAVGDGPLSEIGMMTDTHEGVKVLLPDGTEKSVTAAGWDHFSHEEDDHV